MTPEFSVILPTRGHSPFLGQTIRSVLAGGTATELLLVHDRRDGEGDLDAERLGDPRIRLLTPSRPGVSSARNVALDQARGRFVAFIDDDDVWLPEHLANATAAFQRNPQAIMIGGDALVLDSSQDAAFPAEPANLPRLYPGRSSGPVSLHDLLLENWFHPSTTLLRREALTDSDRFDAGLTHMEDYDLWLRLARRADPVFDRRADVVIRRHAHNASRNRRRMAEGALHVLARALDDRAVAAALLPGERRKREGRLWHDLAYACLVEDDGPGARRAAGEALRRRPLTPKNYLYLLAGGLPAALRRAVVFRGRRALGLS